MIDSKEAFYFLLPNVSDRSWVNTVWGDVRPLADVYLKNNTLESNGFQKLKKLHFSNKMNKRFWIPFKWVWDAVYPIKPSMLDPNKKNYLIFHSGVKFSPRYLHKLKRDYNIRVVLYLPDTLVGLNIAHNEAEWKRYCKYYEIDQVYSFDPEDCRRYGFKFFDIYSIIPELPRAEEDNDLFYIGFCRTKERLDLVRSIYECVHGKVKCDFRMIGVQEGDMQPSDGIIYNEPLGYPDVIKETLKSRCILEIMNPGQKGNTLRYKEAVCYGKKLLSNNPDILTSKYYDPRWMQYFENIEDIDIEWLLSNETPTYNYDGEYSPIRLLEMLLDK